MQCFFLTSKCPASSCTPLKTNPVKCNWLLQKPPTCPTSYEWGWIYYRHRLIFNLRYYHTLKIQNQIHITFTHVLAYKTQKWSKLKCTKQMFHQFCSVGLDIFLSLILPSNSFKLSIFNIPANPSVILSNLTAIICNSSNNPWW